MIRGVRAVVLTAALLLSGCSDDGTRPDVLRFGQSGEILVRLKVPLSLGAGEIQQVVNWSSNGSWQVFESISYGGLIGDEGGRRSPGAASEYAAAYASLIAQINGTPALALFIDELDPELVPDCGPIRTEVTLQIRDAVREETATWVRCGQGSLESLQTQGAGPDAAAGRVLQAAVLVRDFTVGSDFRSDYVGSVPFGTLDRGDDTEASLGEPQAFLGVLDEGGLFVAPSTWSAFWTDHGQGVRPEPSVDWASEMVLVGVVGIREEAGDSVEIRRILQIEDGTLVEMFERVPGDFCAPASRIVRPFHIVLAPRTQPRVRFGETRVERVPCGV